MSILNGVSALRLIDTLTHKSGPPSFYVYVAQQKGLRVASGTTRPEPPQAEWETAFHLTKQVLASGTDHLDPQNTGVLIADRNGGPAIGVVVLVGLGGDDGHTLVRDAVALHGFGLANA